MQWSKHSIDYESHLLKAKIRLEFFEKFPPWTYSYFPPFQNHHFVISTSKHFEMFSQSASCLLSSVLCLLLHRSQPPSLISHSFPFSSFTPSLNPCRLCALPHELLDSNFICDQYDVYHLSLNLQYFCFKFSIQMYSYRLCCN